MNEAIIAIWPIALLIAAAVVGVPLWMTVRHRHAAPDYHEARAHYRAKQAVPGAAASTDFVPTKPVAAVDGLTIVRKTGTADDDAVVPAQRYW
jgi:hypothetical protein